MSSSNGVSKDALANSGTANGMAAGYGGQASGISSILTPTLSKMATAPQGYDPSTLAGMNTAATQSYGGSQSAAVGQGALSTERTNNAGGAAAAIADSNRTNAAGLSDAALGVQNSNAMLKEQQRQEGLTGMEGMYGQDVAGEENALGLSNSALGVANQGKQVANSNPWSQFGRNALQAAMVGAGG